MSENKYEIESVAFEGPKTPDRGYTVKASYLKGQSGDALIQVMLNGTVVRDFLFPAYKVWNIAAHFKDIVDGEIANSDAGYRAAAWNGIEPIWNTATAAKPMSEQDKARKLAEERARNLLGRYYPYYTERAVGGIADEFLQFAQERESEAVDRWMSQGILRHTDRCKFGVSPGCSCGLDALIAKHSKKGAK